jgi:peptidoglycan/xylan/chitin deacetylase (PgdA/CDA1 family)
MDELVSKLGEKNSFTSPTVVITIDDGYLNNYTLAYPVLKELDLPAIIYVSTGFIGTENAPWVDDLMNIFLQTKVKTLCFPELLGEEVLHISSQYGKRTAVTKLFEMMRQIEHRAKMRAMDKLSEILAVKEIYRNSGERKMLNWDEATEMSRHNISFGAHTVTHPILSKMGSEEAKREIYESKMAVEAGIGYKVKHFAIPNGRLEDFSDELKGYCKEIGFATVVSTEFGVVAQKSDLYFLKRISPATPNYVFACELARSMFFSRTSDT